MTAGHDSALPRRHAGARLSGATLSLSLLSHGMRFLANAVLLIVLARLWAPAAFGTFAYANAVAVLLGLVAGWGLVQKAMRDTAVAPAGAGAAVRGAVLAQAALLPACVAAAALLAWIGQGPDAHLLLPLFGACVALNLAETAAAACRGIGRFDAEAQASVVGNGVYFAAGAGTALASGDLTAVAWAMFAGRVVHALAGFAILHRAGIDPRASPGGPVDSLRGGAVFAGEAILIGAFLQIDTVLVKLLLGDAAAGSYQAGIRFVVVALVVAQALAGMFVPVLVARLADRAAFGRLARRVVLTFALFGGACLLLFGIWGGQVTLAVYGADYAATARLAPLFGALVFLRCLAAGMGIVLMAAGEQAWRLVATLAALLSYLAGAAVIGAGLGLDGLVAANLAAVSILFVLYGVKALPRLDRKSVV